jgi:hypothetical protein
LVIALIALDFPTLERAILRVIAPIRCENIYEKPADTAGCIAKGY